MHRVFLRKIALLIVTGVVVLACKTQKKNVAASQTYSYLALGDSYTIGESVCDTCTYAHQLVDSLQQTTNKKIDLKIIATTGWTTTDLLSAIDKEPPASNYDFVTLLIGVNNQYQKKDFSLYEKEFPILLNKAIAFAQGNTKKVVVLSIPDYAYTPFGKGRPNATSISEELDNYNRFAEVTSERLGVTFLQITDITRKGLKQPSLVASDGLHPSKEAYHQFVKRLFNEAKKSTRLTLGG